MIVFDPITWTISLPPGESPIARQFDNLTRSITVTGVPEGWDWTLLVQASGKLDIIDLEPVEGGVGVTLTAQMLSLAGFYTIQLRGTQGDLVRHTNVLQGIMIPASLSGSATWPTVPSAVEQVLQQMEELNQHPPYPGDGGYWMVWDLDTHAYVESQLPLPPVAVGPSGTVTVGETITGQPGTPASVVNTGTESAAVLNFTIPQGQQGNPGAAATVEVGETVTGDPGTEASVENVGTSSAAVLRFTIPAGATGATPDISVEVAGLPGGSEPTVSVSGTPEAPVIYLGIPAGKQGDPGNPGQTPNIEIGSVETLPAGSSVTASITGQTPNLVLNLGIPVGREGAPGTDGVSPEVDIQSTDTGTRVTITDKDGQKEFEVLNGKDGEPGKNGDPGEDGHAATISITETETVAPDSPAAMVELPGSTPLARLYKAQVPRGQTGAGLPPTDTAQDGYIPTFRDGNIVWEPPAGGSGGPDFLADFTVEEAVAQYVVSTDIDPSDYSFFIVHIFDGPSDVVRLKIASGGKCTSPKIYGGGGTHQIAFVFMDIDNNNPTWLMHGGVKTVYGTNTITSWDGATYLNGSSSFPQGLQLVATSELPAGMKCRIKGWK